MALPDFTMRQLLEAGVHFGHQKHRWNPKMGQFIFGVRNNIHIIDLAQTVPLLHQALKTVSDTVAGGGRVLFVGTKRQAQEPIAEYARKSAQYFVNARWLGGMLTNWKTISNSITRLRKLEEMLVGEAMGLTKKERLNLDREREKLERNLGGIKDMGGLPDLVFVVDSNRESNAILEARRLSIPVIAVLDTNSDPDGIDLPIPGNDDAGRAITLYCDLVSRAAIDGISRASADMGVDLGAAEEFADEPALAAEEEAAAEKQVAAEPAPEAEAEEPAAAEESPAEAEAPEKGDAEAPVDDAEEKTAEAEPAEAEPAVEAEEKPAEAEAPPAKSEEPAEEKSEEAPLFVAPEGEPDDLKKISGVGAVLEGKLNSLGITKLEQIANFTPEDVEKVDETLNFKGRVEREDWIEQAKKLIA